ncbi:hypothetical protein BOX15_Mlig013823g2, partial [Macrostomum lignano]
SDAVCRICHAAAGEQSDLLDCDSIDEAGENSNGDCTGKRLGVHQQPSSCHNGIGDSDPLLNLCRCTGSIAYTHAGCLVRWLRKSRVLQYLNRLISKRRIDLFSDVAYSVLLFAPSGAFTWLHFKESDGRRLIANGNLASTYPNATCVRLEFDTLAAMVCGVLLMLLTCVIWLVTVFAAHRSEFNDWRDRIDGRLQRDRLIGGLAALRLPAERIQEATSFYPR